MWATSAIFKKLLKVNSRAMGEKSGNPDDNQRLVTFFM
jgi:hypothetical protein